MLDLKKTDSNGTGRPELTNCPDLITHVRIHIHGQTRGLFVDTRGKKNNFYAIYPNDKKRQQELLKEVKSEIIEAGRKLKDESGRNGKFCHLKNNWTLYFAMESKINSLRKRWKQACEKYPKGGRQAYQAVQFQVWDLNDQKFDLGKKIEHMEKAIEQIERIERKKKEEASVQDSLDDGICYLHKNTRTIIDVELVDGQIVTTSYNGKKNIVENPSTLKREMTILRRHFLKRNEMKLFDYEKASPKLKQFYHMIQFYGTNVSFLDHLVKRELFHQNKELFVDSFHEKIKFYDTKYGPIAIEEFCLLFPATATSDFIVKIKDEIAEGFLGGKSVMSSKKPLLIHCFYKKCATIMRESQQIPTENCTLLFQQIIEYATDIVIHYNPEMLVDSFSSFDDWLEKKQIQKIRK